MDDENQINDEDQMILDNIDEFVNDEGKIVSYKWLSLSLSLNVNKATKLLEEYTIKKSDNDLDVIYFVGGRKNDGLYSTFQYKLAKQNNLDNVKNTFDEVTTCHIYSIQKSCIKDADVLYTNHIDIVNECLSEINKCSAIQCDSVNNLSETLAKRGQHNVPVTNGFHHETNNIEEEAKPPPQHAKDFKSQPHVNKKGKQTSKKEITTKSFFGKASSTKPDTAVSIDTSKHEKLIETESKSIDVKNTNNKTKVEKKNISAAFAKSNNKKTDLAKEIDSPMISETIKSDIETEDKDEEKENHVAKEKRVNKRKKEKTTISPVKEETEVSHAPIIVENSKKRKARVVDSESDDDDFEKFLTKSKDPTYESPEKKSSKPNEKPTKSDDEDIEMIEPTPEPVKKKKRRRTDKDEKKNNEKSKDSSLSTEKPKTEKTQKQDVTKETDKDKVNVENNSTEGGKRRGKRMVMKSKQYLDEDGFMVTRKECESESFSEESDTELSEEKIKLLSPEKKKVVENKKIVIDLEKKTKAHLSKPKTQASLMNFFKKK